MRLFKSQDVPRKAFNECVLLVRTNMREMYNKSRVPEFAWDDCRKRMEMGRPNMYYLLAQQEDGRVTGFASFCLLEDLEGPLVYLYELQVHAEFKGRGTGTRLMQRCAELSHDIAHVPRILLTVLDNNPRARALYTRRGFTEREARTGYSILELRLAPFVSGATLPACRDTASQI